MREIYGRCYKCNSPGRLYEYRSNYFIGKSCMCWDEEVEKDSKRHEKLNDELRDLSKLTQGTQQ